MTTQFYPATEDITVVSKHLRKLIRNIPGAVFSVRCNKQWAKSKDDPKSIIDVQGVIKFWGDDYTLEKEVQSNLMLKGMLKDIAEEYQLELKEYIYAARYALIQRR